jgi:Domain of unknown function (DUF4132)
MVAGVHGGEQSRSGPVALSPYAASLLRVLTVPGAEDDPIVRQPVDVSRVSDLELGVLLPAAYGLPGRHPASLVGWGVEEAGRQRQPRFTHESCAALFAALAEALERGTGGNPVLAVNALLRCQAPWPEQVTRSAGRLVRSLVAGGRLDHPYAVLALAGLAGGLTRRFVTGLFRRPLGPIAREEVDLLSTLGVPAQALVAEVCGDRSYQSPPQLPDAWQRLAAMPEYASFARRALAAAQIRVADVQSGKRPYVADKAFARDEVGVLGRVARVALLHDEPWLAELLRPLLLGVAVAPTAASTLPSQALLYEVARAAGDFPTPEALAALRAARAVVRHKGVPRQLDRMLKRIERTLADRPGVAFRLPDLGFGPDGVRTVAVGGCQAVITVSSDVDLVWRRADGRPSTTVPAALRRDHADDVKALRDVVKQARGHLTTLARALEAGYTAQPAQPYRQWREELAASSLGWSVARRLIWEVQVAGGRWRAVLPGEGGAFHDVTGAPVASWEPDGPIRLWHPLRAAVEEIQDWRDLLTERRVRQPFKQAFREIHLLTPAEAETETYSNRFAAHIVHYRQLYALVRARGWDSRLLGPWDGGETGEASGIFAGGTWRATLRHDYLDHHPDGVECAGTDRVWFDRLHDGAWRTERLAQVPAIVFSEAMRDVDLFVSVSSIAADPHWVDRGDVAYADYWRRGSLGELTATAQVRRAALERLIPRTRIADRCTLTERYLIVRGELHTYRIHLGSASVLIEPDDSYLCIVPSVRKVPDRVFLPFEDERLTLILSKAFLLADDTRISDQSIMAQLRRSR